MTNFQKVIGKIVGDVFENCNLHIKIILYFCASKNIYDNEQKNNSSFQRKDTASYIGVGLSVSI